MKKNTARIMIAVLSLIMAIGIATGSTFAWFSMNNKVLVTGMTVTTKVNNNLLIADALADNTGNTEANYQIVLNQTRAGTLEPVSTIDGVNFFWTSTSNVEGSGDAKTDTYVAYSEDTSLAYAAANKTNYDNEFNTNYGFDAPEANYKGVAYGYIDYTFYLKGTNADSADAKIYMNKCNLLYNGSALTEKAFRVAVFSKGASKNTPQTGEVAVGQLVTILAPADANYISTARYNVETGATGTTSGTDGLYEYITGELYGDNAAQGSVTKWYTTNDLSTAKDVTALVTASAEASAKITDKKQAVNSISTLNTVSNLEEKAIIGDVDHGATAYYKVTIRLWLEGEDTTCNNDTFANLTGDWTLDLGFTLDGNADDNAVTQIDTVGVATLGLSNADKTGTAALANGETADSYAFYKADGTAIANGAEFEVASNVITNLHASAEKVYCIITTDKGNTYRTPTVPLATNSFTLTQTLTDVTSSTAADSVDADFSATYTANDGYTLPTAITVTVGGNALTVDTDYTWNNTTGALTISGSKITGAVVITIIGDAE